MPNVIQITLKGVRHSGVDQVVSLYYRRRRLAAWLRQSSTFRLSSTYFTWISRRVASTFDQFDFYFPV
jgi:hypothetical protein